MTYYGLVDQYDLDSSSNLYLDLNMTLYAIEQGKSTIDALKGKEIYNQTLLNFEELGVCDYRLSGDSANGCPYGGDYTFDTTFTLPAVDNKFKEWLYTGYTGKGKLGVYAGPSYNSRLLGQCVIYFNTAVGESMGVLSNAPDGRSTMIAIISAAGVMVLLGLCCAMCACRNHAKAGQLRKIGEKAKKAFLNARNKVVGPSNDFKLMEDATLEEPSWKNDWDEKAVTGTHSSQKDLINV